MAHGFLIKIELTATNKAKEAHHNVPTKVLHIPIQFQMQYRQILSQQTYMNWLHMFQRIP